MPPASESLSESADGADAIPAGRGRGETRCARRAPRVNERCFDFHCLNSNSLEGDSLRAAGAAGVAAPAGGGGAGSRSEGSGRRGHVTG